LTESKYATLDEAQVERKTLNKLRKDMKELVKNHYSKVLSDKDKAIHSLSATVARLQADL
jgi:hypothetical protein